MSHGQIRFYNFGKRVHGGIDVDLGDHRLLRKHAMATIVQVADCKMLVKKENPMKELTVLRMFHQIRFLQNRNPEKSSISIDIRPV